MEFTGENLKRARIEKKFKINKISEELNISISILNEIENDVYSENDNQTYLIGYIRSYAKFLNLDEDRIINNFKIQTSYKNYNKNPAISKPLDENSIFSGSKTFSIASVLIIAFSFYFLFVKHNDLYPNYAMTPDVPENLQYDLENTDMNLALLNKVENINLKLNQNTKFDESDLIKEKSLNINNNQNVSSAIASTPDEDIQNIKKDILLSFLQSTWIQLRNKDNKIIFSKLMRKNEEFSYSLSENLMLTAGNAGNIILSLRGVTIGKIGKSGEVIDSLIIDQNFKN